MDCELWLSTLNGERENGALDIEKSEAHVLLPYPVQYS
jgi:hypothetical protein